MNAIDPGHAVRQQCVLVVDDSLEVITLVDATLRPVCRVSVALSGEQALQLLERGTTVDLVLLDILMPGIDGLEVCRRMRQHPRWRDIPVLFLTALNQPHSDLEGLELGAVDYLAKPVIPAILRARVATHLELCRARHDLQQHNQRLSVERSLIEEVLLRMRDDAAFDSKGIRRLMAPVEITGGDLALSGRTPDGRRLMLLGDFTGHGLTAALAGPLVKHFFYALVAENATVERLLLVINELLWRSLPTWQFMAAQLLEVPPGGQSYRLLNAGMPAALHLTLDGHMAAITASAPPLGITAEPVPGTSPETRPSQPGDRLLLYTDGIIEASSPSGEHFGEARLRQTWKELLSEDLPFTHFCQAVAAHHGATQAEDDISLMEITL